MRRSRSARAAPLPCVLTELGGQWEGETEGVGAVTLLHFYGGHGIRSKRREDGRDQVMETEREKDSPEHAEGSHRPEAALLRWVDGGSRGHLAGLEFGSGSRIETGRVVGASPPGVFTAVRYSAVHHLLTTGNDPAWIFTTPGIPQSFSGFIWSRTSAELVWPT